MVTLDNKFCQLCKRFSPLFFFKKSAKIATILSKYKSNKYKNIIGKKLTVYFKLIFNYENIFKLGLIFETIFEKNLM